jgi:hypothetical protein
MAEQQDYDSPWKELLDLQFEEFMAFFFPSAHAQIDWRAGHEFLDKELQKITLDAALGRRVVDKLVKVQLTNGQEQWVLVHVEVQTQPANDFPERLFVYHYRIRDRFDARCATFGVLADGDPGWRPAEFRDELLGTELVMRCRKPALGAIIPHRRRPTTPSRACVPRAGGQAQARCVSETRPGATPCPRP